MPKFKIPMTWEVCSILTISADSLDSAIKYAREESDNIPLPDDGEYVDGSFDVSGDDDFVKECYNSIEETQSSKCFCGNATCTFLPNTIPFKYETYTCPKCKQVFKFECNKFIPV